MDRENQEHRTTTVTRRTIGFISSRRQFLRRYKIVIIFVIAILVIAPIALELIAVIPAGRLYQIPDSKYLVIGPTHDYAKGITLTGAFYVQDGSVEFAVMTPQQYNAFHSNPLGSNNHIVYGTGPVIYGTVDAHLPPGTYYFVFVNEGLSTVALWITLPFLITTTI